MVACLLLVAAGGWYTDMRRPLPHPLQPVEGLSWWFTPVERNAFMRLPVVSDDLYAVDASDDGQVIWAVGEKALIVGTTDGGRTWRQGRVMPLSTDEGSQPGAEPTPSTAEPKPAAAAFNFMRTLNPVAAARAARNSNEPVLDLKQQMSKEADESNATPQLSSPTGTAPQATATVPQATVKITPSKLATPPTNSKLENTDLPSVHQQGSDVAQENPAEQKSLPSRASALNSTLVDVTIIDAQHAVAVGDNGVILRTQDGGETWSQRRSPVAAGLLSVAFANADVGLAVGELGTVLRTEDGGASWNYESRKSSGRLWGVAAVDARRWVIVGQDGLIADSSDGGRNWNYQRAVTESTLTSVAFMDARNGVACSSTQLLRTGDGGRTWSIDAGFERPASGQLEDVAVSGGRIVVVDSEWRVYAYDGAWSRHTLRNGGNQPQRLKLAGNGSVYVVGEYGALTQSTDFGRHWRPLTAYRGIFQSIFTNRHRGVILGPIAAPDVEVEGILATSDGGMTWTPRFKAATFVDAALRIASVRTEDIAASWLFPSGKLEQPVLPADFKLPPEYSGRAFADNRTGLVVTDRVSHSQNGGETWLASEVPTPAPVVDVAYAGPDRAIAVAQGRVLVSDDAGKTFRPVIYKRYPSPWLWLACALLLACAALLLRRSLRKPEVEQQPSSITDAAASDRPIEWGDPDPAGLRDIALGLSRFLRNRRTEPPLTVAVTGEWGTGKSSLMNLLRYDLVRYGYKPVWFNAWHHQSGENLLGSLLANIHAQGVPPLHTVAGLDFRLTLLAIRSRRFWWRLALTLFLVAVVFFSYETLGARAAQLWAELIADSHSGDAGGISNFKAATGLAGIVAAVLAPLIGAVRAASAFGLQPAKLIAAVATTRHDESARLQAGARYRFAREFADFTRALDTRPLVIFIDDLDRCRAENVIEVLEAVNFLISSGRCIVVIGMARRWVETCVGLAFKELAKAHLGGGEPAADFDAADAADNGATEQQIFARHYLEKLINVEIRVPRLSDSAAGAILQGGAPQTPSSSTLRYGLGTVLLRTGAGVILIAIVAGVIALGKYTADWLAFVDAATAPPPVSSPAAAGASTQTTHEPTASPQSADNAPALFDAPRAPTSMGWYFSTGTSVVLALLAFAAVAMFARKESRTDDSPAFRDALGILQPWIVVGGSSPRSLKRFINHVRYIAMRFRPAADIPTAYERIANRIRAWFGRAPIESAHSGMPTRLQLSEELLVALATLHRCNENWLDELFIARERDLDLLLIRDIGPQIEDEDERQVVLKRLREALARFNERFVQSALFENGMLDRRHAIAFYEVLAYETGIRAQAPAEEAAPPRPAAPRRTAQ